LEGIAEGTKLGCLDNVGSADNDGFPEGAKDGDTLGFFDGEEEGSLLGTIDLEGAREGERLGEEDGDLSDLEEEDLEAFSDLALILRVLVVAVVVSIMVVS